MEEGATRNFEAFRLARMQEEKAKKEKEDEEANNPMKVRNCFSMKISIPFIFKYIFILYYSACIFHFMELMYFFIAIFW